MLNPAPRKLIRWGAACKQGLEGAENLKKLSDEAKLAADEQVKGLQEIASASEEVASLADEMQVF